MRLASVVGPLVGLLLFVGRAYGASYFVAPDGDDMASGSATKPWRTLQRAAYVKPGDVINVRAGTYDVGKRLLLDRAGAENAWIVFRAAEGARPVIVAPSGDGPMVIIAARYIELRGFEIKDSPSMGVLVNTSHVRIVDNVIHDNTSGGIWASPESPREDPAITDILVEGNVVYRNNKKNAARTATGGWTGGITGQNTTNYRIIANRAYENWGEGIVLNLTQHSRAERNIAYDNYATNIYLDNAQDTVVDGNFAYQTGHEMFLRNDDGVWKPGTGMQLANEDYKTISKPLDRVRITNNIVVGGRASFFYGRYEAGGGLKNTLVANNTFVSPVEEFLHVESGPHSAVFTNNIFFAAKETPNYVGQTGTLPVFQSNGWFGVLTRGKAGSETDVHRMDPLLVKPGGLDPADYKLNAGSPMVGKGTPHADVKTDFFGAARGATNDIGAHQLGGMPAPAPDGGATPTPVPPPPPPPAARDGGAAPAPAMDAGSTTADAAARPATPPAGAAADAAAGGRGPSPRDAAVTTPDDPPPPPARPASGCAAAGNTHAWPGLLLVVCAVLLLRRRRA